MAIAQDNDQSANKFGLYVIGAATICTLTMNAVFGYNASTILYEALLFAAFSIIMDLVKLTGLRQVFYHFERFAYVKAGLSAIVWTGALSWCLLSAFGFAGMVKESTVSTKTDSTGKYKDAMLKKTNAKYSLDMATASNTWLRTSGCTDATLDESKEFCKQVAFRKKEIEEAEKVMADLGPPKVIDPQAAMLSSLTGVSEKNIRFYITFFFALLAEFTTAFGYVMYTKSRRPDGFAKKVKKAPARKTSSSSNVRPFRR